MSSLKKAAIIGGGPCGFAVARALLGEDNLEVHIFESQNSYGGLWHYQKGAGPMYRDLHANVPRPLMEFADEPIPESKGLFMFREDIDEYVHAYSAKIAKDPRVVVNLNALVNSVDKDKVNDKWIIEYGDNKTFVSDFVVIATGHYHYPLWPKIPGLRSHPDIIHAHDYDSPEEYRDKKVLLIGHASSGTDLAIQILAQTKTLHLSRREVSPLDEVFDASEVVWKPQATNIEGRKVSFDDGTVEEYDSIIVCTGYLYEFPFLKYKGEPNIPLLHPERIRLMNFYHHTFYSGDPTLATVGMNRFMVPFPFFETQGAVIARVWSQRLQLPPLNDRLAYEKDVLELKGDSVGFHDLKDGADLTFMETFWAWADEASGKGFSAEHWSEEKLTLRKEIFKVMAQHNRDRIAKSLNRRKHLESGLSVPAIAQTDVDLPKLENLTKVSV